MNGCLGSFCARYLELNNPFHSCNKEDSQRDTVTSCKVVFKVDSVFFVRAPQLSAGNVAVKWTQSDEYQWKFNQVSSKRPIATFTIDKKKESAQ
jgi:hypothetical protein